MLLISGSFLWESDVLAVSVESVKDKSTACNNALCFDALPVDTKINCSVI